MEKPKVNTDQRLINALLLHSSFIDNLGLLNGKMGISIFFYHLARETGNSIYEDYAGELIDEIYDEISLNTPMDFANGLAGIGWGIEYLVQNHFIEADTVEVLEEIDKRLMSFIYGSPPSIGLCEGLVGYGAYLLKCIQNPHASDEKIQTLINKQLMIRLISELGQRIHDISVVTMEPFQKQSGENIQEATKQEKGSTGGERAFTFDLTWDYPVLLAFLTEVFLLEFSNVKVSHMLQRLVSPLQHAVNYPRLHVNRLLLAMALSKITYSLSNGQSCIRNTTNDFNLNVNLKKIIQGLLSEIGRRIILRELKPNCAFLMNGTMGIAWIYQQLFEFTAVKKYQTEADYWSQKSLQLVEPKDYDRHGSERGNEQLPLGLLKGYAGLVFTASVLRNTVLTKQKKLLS